jgi:hypothetical protein
MAERATIPEAPRIALIFTEAKTALRRDVACRAPSAAARSDSSAKPASATPPKVLRFRTVFRVVAPDFPVVAINFAASRLILGSSRPI